MAHIYSRTVFLFTLLASPLSAATDISKKLALWGESGFHCTSEAEEHARSNIVPTRVALSKCMGVTDGTNAPCKDEAEQFWEEENRPTAILLYNCLSNKKINDDDWDSPIDRLREITRGITTKAEHKIESCKVCEVDEEGNKFCTIMPAGSCQNENNGGI